MFLFYHPTLGKSLIKYVLVRIEEFLYQENLTVEWASFPAGKQCTVLIYFMFFVFV